MRDGPTGADLAPWHGRWSPEGRTLELARAGSERAEAPGFGPVARASLDAETIVVTGDPPDWLAALPATGLTLLHVSLPEMPRALLPGRTRLALWGWPRLTRLPPLPGLASLDLNGCPNLAALPNGLRLTWLSVHNCRQLGRLPLDLVVEGEALLVSALGGGPLLPDQLRGRVARLELTYHPQRHLPRALAVTERLVLSSCPKLERLPAGLALGQLVLSSCGALETLPDDLVLSRQLSLADCSRLADLGGSGVSGRVEELTFSSCPLVRRLPPNLAIGPTARLGGMDDAGPFRAEPDRYAKVSFTVAGIRTRRALVLG